MVLLVFLVNLAIIIQATQALPFTPRYEANQKIKVDNILLLQVNKFVFNDFFLLVTNNSASRLYYYLDYNQVLVSRLGIEPISACTSRDHLYYLQNEYVYSCDEFGENCKKNESGLTAPVIGSCLYDDGQITLIDQSEEFRPRVVTLTMGRKKITHEYCPGWQSGCLDLYFPRNNAIFCVNGNFVYQDCLEDKDISPIVYRETYRGIDYQIEFLVNLNLIILTRNGFPQVYSYNLNGMIYPQAVFQRDAWFCVFQYQQGFHMAKFGYTDYHPTDGHFLTKYESFIPVW